LSSLSRSTWPNLRTIVVDNGSDDGTEVAVRASHPDAAFIQLGSNLGFASGNNVGIRVALAGGADAVLILNNDTLVPPEAIERMVRALQDDLSAGACSPVIAYTSRPERLWFAGATYDPRHWHAGRASSYERGAALPTRPAEIDRAVGAAMLVRAEVIEALGAFDDELFFLYEDVEWSLRIRKAGWRILLVPAARISHRVSASQGGASHTGTTAYFGTRNDLVVGRRHGGLSRWRAHGRDLACVGVHLVGVRRAEPGQRAAYMAGVIAGWRDYRAGRLGPRGRPGGR
jgi:GT2 family glycosyltransferase